MVETTNSGGFNGTHNLIHCMSVTCDLWLHFRLILFLLRPDGGVRLRITSLTIRLYLCMDVVWGLAIITFIIYYCIHNTGFWLLIYSLSNCIEMKVCYTYHCSWFPVLTISQIITNKLHSMLFNRPWKVLAVCK